MYRHSVVFTIVVLLAPAAQGGIWSNVFTGLDILATPSGSPVISGPDGSRINGARSGRLRIVPNGVLGEGYRLEFDRSFGADSRGRPEVLRLGGAAELQLTGATQWTAGYNTGGIISGFSQLQISGLNYTLRSKLGAEDALLTGTLNATANIEVNQLGFYNLVLSVANENSQLELDGVVARSEESANFTVGPIVVSGNLFIDSVVALLARFGADTSFFEQLFPESPISQLDKESTAKLETALGDAAETDEQQMAALLLGVVLGGDAGAGDALIEGLRDGVLIGNGVDEESRVIVPEPGTLLVMALGGATLWCARRRTAGAS